MRKFFLIYSVWLNCLFSGVVQANIGIDTMMAFTTDDETSFTLTNSADYRQFIQVAISGLSVDGGQLKQMNYSRENIDEWRLSARPARAPVDSKMAKEFYIKFTPKNKEERSKDHAFRLTFVPTPYFQEGEKAKHAMQIAVGFAPIVIAPADKDQPLSYELIRRDDSLVFHNMGGTYIRAFMDACPNNAADKTTCLKTVYVLSGRKLIVDLNEQFKKTDTIRFKLSTHHLDYRQDVTLNHGQTIKK